MMLFEANPSIVLIPAINEEWFIGSMVLSVRLFVDEVIVVDDESQDRTSDLVRRDNGWNGLWVKSTDNTLLHIVA